MRLLMSLFVFLGMVYPAFAEVDGVAELQAEIKKADELDLENEVEDIEHFGADATAEETKKETDRLVRETRSLEKEIAAMKRANIRAQEKANRLNALFQKKDALSKEVRKQAAQAESKKVQSERVVSRMKSRVDRKEKEVIGSVQKRKAAERRITELNSENRKLERRLKVAENSIKRNEEKRRVLRDRALKLSRKNSILNKKVVQAENRARSTRL